MEAAHVRGLIPLHEMLRLDHPRGWIVGIAALRGRDFPVIDLPGKLGLAHGSHGRQPCVVVVEAPGPRLVGFIADRVSRVVPLRDPDLSRGTLRIAGRTRRLLDPGQILDEEVVVTP